RKTSIPTELATSTPKRPPILKPTPGEPLAHSTGMKRAASESNVRGVTFQQGTQTASDLTRTFLSSKAGSVPVADVGNIDGGFKSMMAKPGLLGKLKYTMKRGTYEGIKALLAAAIQGAVSGAVVAGAQKAYSSVTGGSGSCGR